ncbi:hypothetical protein FE697_014830 [Mumia zhuanghuii]|uniref:Uncharacterized protein n=2 Tax=Mumia TaxID=1546255 RepID=A0ABW1QPN0_9ACTN|nr:MULTISPECIES: hypothetical protein [Mumia]KAA1422420.1 hypothetical protein FE697_014830 [Mumia zhuanghuii]
MTATPQSADLDAIWASLDETGVYVDPSMTSQITADQVAEIEANVARTEEPTYVVAYPLAFDDEFSGRAEDLLATVHDHNPQPGVYLATDTGFGEPRLEGKSWETTTDDYAAYKVTFAAEHEHPSNLGDQLVAATEMLADGTTEARYNEEWTEYEKESESTSSSTSSSSSYDDGGGSTGPIVAGSLTIAIVVVAIALARTWRRYKIERGDIPGRKKAFALPASVVERVRDAHDSALIARADRELLALGELIDETDMQGDAAAWQAALDHYDAAKRTRGEGSKPDVLDVVGTLVLVERGSAALDAATAGKAYKPTAPCYLNPLHGAANGRTTLDTATGKVTVPLCAACRRDLKAHRRPDILDVVRGGKPVHYFDSGVEPWASTGYGSLELDLVTQLHRTRR